MDKNHGVVVYRYFVFLIAPDQVVVFDRACRRLPLDYINYHNNDNHNANNNNNHTAYLVVGDQTHNTMNDEAPRLQLIDRQWMGEIIHYLPGTPLKSTLLELRPPMFLGPKYVEFELDQFHSDQRNSTHPLLWVQC